MGTYGAAENKTFNARVLDTNLGRRTSAAERSGTHALGGKNIAMQKTLSGIQQERANLARLKTLAETPGYAHERIQSLKILAVSARELYFKNILAVVGRGKAWSEKQADLASRSLDVRLFWGERGDLQSRVSNWIGWLGVGEEYARRREELFVGRIHGAQRILADEV